MISEVVTMANVVFVERSQRIYRFLWVGCTGPKVKLFESLDAFTGYVQECRRILGDDLVVFRTPFLAVGTFR